VTQLTLKSILSISLPLLLWCSVLLGQNSSTNPVSEVWVPDLGNGRYKNPVIYADYSDPDVIRVRDDYYMTASSFNCAPGLPILHSRDLVNWEIIAYAFDRQIPEEVFSLPQHGNGVWAPAIRYHNGKFYIYYGDPDFGIYMTQTDDPGGPWTTPHLVVAGKGWIDPCPLWDDDGRAYLVHAWAGSRAGIKSVLVVHEMSPDGKTLLNDGVMVFDGHEEHPTVEGPKLYKRDGYYYILAPAGGVSTGWQLALRSRNIYGPYESRVAMHQGITDINGPHQGGWVETQTGQHWFLHFQDQGAYGRVVHLNPLEMVDGWPMIGKDIDHDGIGEPVTSYNKPDVGGDYPISTPQASDEFNEPRIGLQWQWQANPDVRWGYPTGYGVFRLNAVHIPDDYQTLWQVPNLFLQKISSNRMVATALLDFHPAMNGDQAGLVIMGEDYSYIALKENGSSHYLEQWTCKNARSGGREELQKSSVVNTNKIYLRVTIEEGAECTFSYSFDGIEFQNLGTTFTARPGRWIGAKVGLFCISKQETNDSGYVDVDWFRVTAIED